MRYILDFDRVLFDTDSFIAALKEHGIADIPRGPLLVTAVEEKGIDWTAFVYPAARDFLDQYGDVCVVVSSYVSRHRLDNDAVPADLELFQREKIRRAGVTDRVQQVVITDEHKVDALRQLSSTEKTILVDDEYEHILAGQDLGYLTVWVRTEKNQGVTPLQEAGAVIEVHSFQEFTQWNQKQ